MGASMQQKVKRSVDGAAEKGSARGDKKAGYLSTSLTLMKTKYLYVVRTI